MFEVLSHFVGVFVTRLDSRLAGGQFILSLSKGGNDGRCMLSVMNYVKLNKPHFRNARTISYHSSRCVQCRRAALSYCIYFRGRDKRIVVLAAFLSARNPEMWQAGNSDSAAYFRPACVTTCARSITR